MALGILPYSSYEPPTVSMGQWCVYHALATTKLYSNSTRYFHEATYIKIGLTYCNIYIIMICGECSISAYLIFYVFGKKCAHTLMHNGGR